MREIEIAHASERASEQERLTNRTHTVQLPTSLMMLDSSKPWYKMSSLASCMPHRKIARCQVLQ